MRLHTALSYALNGRNFSRNTVPSLLRPRVNDRVVRTADIPSSKGKVVAS